MRNKYKAALSLSVIALLVFIGLAIHAVTAFARSALSIIEELYNYMIYAAPFVITVFIVSVEVVSTSKTIKSKLVFSLSAVALLVLTELTLHSISVHVTDVAQSIYDALIVLYASIISVMLLDMVITGMLSTGYREEMVMILLGIALLLLTAGLLGHIAWALGKGLGAGFDFNALLVSSIISTFDGIGLVISYLSGII